MTRKLVFDTSSLVSAALRPDSIPDQAVSLVLKAHQPFVSAELLEELGRVLRRKRFDAYVDFDSRMAFLETIRVNAQLFAVTESGWRAAKGVSRDAKDDFILALALSASVDEIVSSDQDLLVLQRWRGMPIVTPAQFVDEISKETSS